MGEEGAGGVMEYKISVVPAGDRYSVYATATARDGWADRLASHDLESSREAFARGLSLLEELRATAVTLGKDTPPIEARSMSEYKRLKAQGADVQKPK